MKNTLRHLLAVTSDPCVPKLLWRQLVELRTQHEALGGYDAYKAGSELLWSVGDLFLSRMDHERRALFYDERFGRLLKELILDKLPAPIALSLETIKMHAMSQFAGVPTPEDFKVAFRQFVGLIVMDLTHNLFGAMIEMEVEGAWSCHVDYIYETGSIAETCGFGFVVSWEDTGSMESSDRVIVTPTIAITFGSEHGLTDDQEEKLTQCLSSTLESFRLLSCVLNGSKYGRTEELTQKNIGPFLTRSLYASDPRTASGDAFGCRLYSAMQRIIEADSTDDVGLKGRLSMSAVEALLCSGCPDVQELCLNAAAVLEPDALKRQDVVRRLTELHESCARLSEFAQDSTEIANRARVLAAAVLFTVCDWLDHADRLGTAPTFESFSLELSNCLSQGEPVVGIRRTLQAFSVLTTTPDDD